MKHPYGVLPWGQSLLSDMPDIRPHGLGPFMSSLSDELLFRILGVLSPAALGRLAVCSRALMIYTSHDELWKALLLEDLQGSFQYTHSWKHTLLSRTFPAHRHAPGPVVAVHGIYSDYIYQGWACAAIDTIPEEWLEVDNIPRRAGLSAADFRAEFEVPNKPVILMDAMNDWGAMEKWSREYLRAAFRGGTVLAGHYAMTFEDYLQYCDAQQDEMPLYLFDRSFAAPKPSGVNLGADCHVPRVFPDDLFSVLEADPGGGGAPGAVLQGGEVEGEGQRRHPPGRPDYRWLIMGPARSGSTFHKDPNATSAWNGVVSGAKKWVLYPPGTSPPGVHASEDGREVACPVSLLEWFQKFYDFTRQGERPAEAVVRTGELIFVPRGWWHCALNLEESVAVTQNFVSPVNLKHVLAFLGSRDVELVSGCDPRERGSLHDRFVAALRRTEPEVLDRALGEMEADARERHRREGLAGIFRAAAAAEGPRAGCGSESGGSGGFRFNF